MGGYPRFLAGNGYLVLHALHAIQIRKEHAAAMDTAWNAAGWQPIHPKHKSDTVLRREALRLHRRAVLAWSWEAIATEEEREVGDFVDPETVRTSVRRWSRALGVKKTGEANFRERLHLAAHTGPMLLACQFCRTRDMAPDACSVTWTMDSDPRPVIVICQRCVAKLDDAMSKDKTRQPATAGIGKRKTGW